MILPKMFIPRKGFTLIELLLVIALSAVIGTFGMVSYMQFNNAQQLENAALDVSLLLQKAKSRAQSQVKPVVPACSSATDTLTGYEVRISAASRTYELYIVCGTNSGLQETKILPSSVSFDVSSQTPYRFLVLTGAVNAGTIKLNGSSGSKTVTVDTAGNIKIQ